RSQAERLPRARSRSGWRASARRRREGRNVICDRTQVILAAIRAEPASVIAGLDPAIHPARKKHSLRKKMDHPKSGLPDFGRFRCASRINPTCVVKPAGDTEEA